MDKIQNQLYTDLIEYAKKHKWKVRHLKYIPNWIAEVRLSKKTIVINSKLRNTYFGCFVLAHELGHVLDFLANRFEKFFYAPNGVIKNKKLIREVEWSATCFAREVFKQYNISLKSRPYTSIESFEAGLPYWIKMYAVPDRYEYSSKK